MKKLTLYLPEPYIKAIDKLAGEHYYPNRAEAIRTAIRDIMLKEDDLLKEMVWDDLLTETNVHLFSSMDWKDKRKIDDLEVAFRDYNETLLAVDYKNQLVITANPDKDIVYFYKNEAKRDVEVYEFSLVDFLEFLKKIHGNISLPTVLEYPMTRKLLLISEDELSLFACLLDIWKVYSFLKKKWE